MHLDAENISPSYSILLKTTTEPEKGVSVPSSDTAASYIHMYIIYVHFPN